MHSFDEKNPQTSFGAFKPVGNIVAVFDDSASATKAQADLLASGLKNMEVIFMAASDFIALLDELNGQESVLAILGSELRKTDIFRKHAEDGASFLIAFAPSEEETKHVMTIVERYRYRYALKYGHMFIEHFDPEHPASAQLQTN